VPKSDLIRFDRSLVQFDFVVVADVFRVSARVPAGGGIQVVCNEGGSLRTLVWLKFFICCLVFSLPDQMSQLSPFEVGQIKAHVHHGMSGAAISRILRKPDGKSTWSETAVQDAMEKLASQLVGEENEKRARGDHAKQQKRRISRLCVRCSKAVAVTRSR
jgi:hypothetical protein